MHQSTPFQVKNVFFLGRGDEKGSPSPRPTCRSTKPLDPPCISQNSSQIYAMGIENNKNDRVLIALRWTVFKRRAWDFVKERYQSGEAYSDIGLTTVV